MEFCRIETKGHVPHVTITRPKVINALHATAHAELNGVWDDSQPTTISGWPSLRAKATAPSAPATT